MLKMNLRCDPCHRWPALVVVLSVVSAAMQVECSSERPAALPEGYADMPSPMRVDTRHAAPATCRALDPGAAG